jgi:hypothetical protein
VDLKRALAAVRSAVTPLAHRLLDRPGAAAPTVEIHVPISPTEQFVTQIHYLAASLRQFGGLLSESRLVVTVGDDCEPYDLAAANPWARHYPIEWRWLDRALYQQHRYFATAAQRFQYRFTDDLVLNLDADTLIVAPLDDLLLQAAAEPAIHGMIAHLSPAGMTGNWESGVSSLEEFWPALFSSAGLPSPALVCQHAGWGKLDFPGANDPATQFSPPYFNQGVLLAPREIMAQIGQLIYDEMAASDCFAPSHFRLQLAITLAIHRTEAPWRAIPMRYNLANDHRLVASFPDELRHARIVHYLRSDQIDRARFTSPTAVGDMLNQSDLTPVNQLLRDRLAELQETVLAESNASR